VRIGYDTDPRAKDLFQIDPELLVEVLADGSNGDVIYSSVHKILEGADTMLNGPRHSRFHPFT
jgi:hypothetical protein